FFWEKINDTRLLSRGKIPTSFLTKRRNSDSTSSPRTQLVRFAIRLCLLVGSGRRKFISMENEVSAGGQILGKVGSRKSVSESRPSCLTEKLEETSSAEVDFGAERRQRIGGTLAFTSVPSRGSSHPLNHLEKGHCLLSIWSLILSQKKLSSNGNTTLQQIIITKPYQTSRSFSPFFSLIALSRFLISPSPGMQPGDYKDILSPTGSSSPFANGTIRFDQVRKSDEGNYLCEARNDVGSGLSKVIFLKVNG
ncbi:Down syndrome cell adhesion molecule-like protein Dscam2, partial [Folsomia candida]